MAEVGDISEHRGLVTICLGGVRWCSLRWEHYALSLLERGDEIDPERYAQHMAALQMNDCYEAALTLLDRADRSRRDIARALYGRATLRPLPRPAPTGSLKTALSTKDALPNGWRAVASMRRSATMPHCAG